MRANDLVDLREPIDKSLSDLVEIVPVEIKFLEELSEVFSTTNIYLFGSPAYEDRIGDFLNRGNNKDLFFELITVFYSCLVVRGLDYSNFKSLATWILGIKKNMPTNENVRLKEGYSELMRNEQPDIYRLCLYLLHMNYNKFYNLLYTKLELGNKKWVSLF